jgi:hypothetical protein
MSTLIQCYNSLFSHRIEIILSFFICTISSPFFGTDLAVRIFMGIICACLIVIAVHALCVVFVARRSDACRYRFRLWDSYIMLSCCVPFPCAFLRQFECIDVHSICLVWLHICHCTRPFYLSEGCIFAFLPFLFIFIYFLRNFIDTASIFMFLSREQHGIYQIKIFALSIS